MKIRIVDTFRGGRIYCINPKNKTRVCLEVHPSGYLDTTSFFQQLYAEYLYTQHIKYTNANQRDVVASLLIAGIFL